MNFRKIFRWVKIIWLLLYVILVTIGVSWIAIMTWLALADDNAINNSQMVNFLSLTIGLASLPGAFVQLITIIDINKKKEYIATTQCPKCRHNVDLRLIED